MDKKTNSHKTFDHISVKVIYKLLTQIGSIFTLHEA